MSSSSPSLPFYFSLHNVFQKAVTTQDLPNPVGFNFIVCRIFLSSLTVSNTSFVTLSVHLNCSKVLVVLNHGNRNRDYLSIYSTPNVISCYTE